MSNFRRRLLGGNKEEEKYITLSGKYIDTGILGSSDLRIETKAFMDSIDDVDFIIFCEYIPGVSTNENRYSFLKANRRLRTDYGTRTDIMYNVSVETIYYPTVIVKDGVKTYINGELVYTVNEPNSFEGGTNIYIASQNSTYRRHKVFVYYFKIYKDDTLILDLKPYNETDMIDKLTGTIYPAIS